MIYLTRLLAAIIAITMLAPATAAPPLLKQPAGKWLVEYAKDQCLLSRQFGSDAKPLILTLERLPMSEEVELHILRSTAKSDTGWGPAEVGAGGAPGSSTKYSAYTIASRPLRLINLNVPKDQFPAIVQRETIALRVASEKLDERLALPRIAAALQALDDCVLDLGRAWGFSVAQQRAVREGPKPNAPLAMLFSSDDYPSAAILNGEMGRVRVRIAIDPAGRPSACSMGRPSGSKLLDETTCRILMKRAHFLPAVGQDGRPVPSLYVTSISWLLAS
ncbi:MAG: energy transducer TonB [Sphingomicrobium sp.]